MKIEVGDRVRALKGCRMADQDIFYREGDTGRVVRFADGLGAWVKWDNNHIDDGVWYASIENLALIEEDTSGVDVLAELDRRIELEAALYDGPGTDELRTARAAVAALLEVADEAYGEMLADSTRDGPRCLLLTRLEAALARCRGGDA